MSLCFYFEIIWLLGWTLGPRCRTDAGVTKRVFVFGLKALYNYRYRVPEFLKRNAVPQPAEHGTKKLQEDSLCPSITQTHQHKTTNKNIRTPCCCLTLARLLTDAMLGNTFGTVWESQKQIWGTKWLEYWVTSKQKPRTHRKLPQQPTKQRGTRKNDDHDRRQKQNQNKKKVLMSPLVRSRRADFSLCFIGLKACHDNRLLTDTEVKWQLLISLQGFKVIRGNSQRTKHMLMVATVTRHAVQHGESRRRPQINEKEKKYC